MSMRELASLRGIQPRKPRPGMLAKVTNDSPQATIYTRNILQSPLLRLPAEVRLLICEFVLKGHVISVRLQLDFPYAVRHFRYCIHDDSENLPQVDLTLLNSVCRQLYQETAVLPFKLNIWKFETAYVLDEFLQIEDNFSLSQRRSIKAIAVPTPGPYRSSEKFLKHLDMVTVVTRSSQNWNWQRQISPLTRILRKRKNEKEWDWGGKRARYVKDVIE